MQEVERGAGKCDSPDRWSPAMRVLIITHGAMFYNKLDYTYLVIGSSNCQQLFFPLALPVLLVTKIGACPLVKTPLNVLGKATNPLHKISIAAGP